jgi:hypothetical protein
MISVPLIIGAGVGTGTGFGTGAGIGLVFGGTALGGSLKVEEALEVPTLGCVLVLWLGLEVATVLVLIFFVPEPVLVPIGVLVDTGASEDL